MCCFTPLVCASLPHSKETYPGPRCQVCRVRARGRMVWALQSAVSGAAPGPDVALVSVRETDEPRDMSGRGAEGQGRGPAALLRAWPPRALGRSPAPVQAARDSVSVATALRVPLSAGCQRPPRGPAVSRGDTSLTSDAHTESHRRPRRTPAEEGSCFPSLV